MERSTYQHTAWFQSVINMGKTACFVFCFLGFFFSLRMLNLHGSCQSDWWDMLMLGQRMMLTVSLLCSLTMLTKKLYWADIRSWPTFVCLYPRLAKLPCFKLLDLVGQRKWRPGNCLQKLSNREVIVTLLFPLIWSVILTQSWTSLQINPILEKKKMTVFIGRLVLDIFRDIFENWQLSCMSLHLQLIKLEQDLDLEQWQDLDFKQVLVHVLRFLIFY